MITAPGTLYSTYDVFTGYIEALEALNHEVWPFDHHGWLRFYDITLGQWQLHEPELELPMTAPRVLAAEHVVIEAVDAVPDVVLIVTAMGLHRRAFELLGRLGLPVALLLTESPYEDEIQATVMEKGHISLAFTNERTSATTLEEETGIRTVYLPHAYDPERHRPMSVGAEFETDVFFWGTLWPKRKELLEEIEDLPYDIKFGGIWPHSSTRDEAEENLENVIDNDEIARWYSGTKIAINHHREFCTIDDEGQRYLGQGEAESLGPRAYEIAACGAFQLCDETRAELRDVFGQSVATYSDAQDLRRKIKYYIQHDDERQAMAREARERVQGCTFERRAEEIVAPALEEIT